MARSINFRYPSLLTKAVAPLLKVLSILVLTGACAAQTPEVVTDISEYYNHPERFVGVKIPARLEFVVNYYDPEWSILFAQTGDHCYFIRPSKRPAPIQPGQKVSVQGWLSKEAGLELDEDRIQVLNTDAFAEPVAATERLHEWSALTNRMVTVEGFVDNQSRSDPTHHRLDLVVRGRRVSARIHTPNSTLDNFKGTIVRVTGIYTFNSGVGDSVPVIEIWVAGAARVAKVRNLSDDNRFEIPSVSIETASNRPSGDAVRIVGTVHRQNLGQSLTLRDTTGEVEVLTAQNEPVPTGTLVEAIGVPRMQGTVFTLGEGQFRKAPIESQPFLPSSDGQRVLKLIDYVLDLSEEQLAGQPPVSLFGVVTWFHADSPYFFIQDATSGILVRRPTSPHDVLNFGALVRVQGKAVRGLLGAEVQAESLRRGADSIPSSARQITLDQAYAGVAKNQWVEIQGFVHNLVETGAWCRMECTTSSGEFFAQVHNTPVVKKFKNALVRVRGICTTAVDDRGEISGIRILIQSTNDILVDAALPSDFSGISITPISQIRNLGTRVELNRWVRTSGTVTLQVPGSHVYLQRGSDSLKVFCRSNTAIPIGSVLDVAGLAGREDGRRVLREGQIISVLKPDDTPISPIRLTETLSSEVDGKLARLTGVVRNVLDVGDQKRLIVQLGQLLVECRVPMPPKSVPAEKYTEKLKPYDRKVVEGAIVTCEGVCRAVVDDNLHVTSLSLALENASFVTVDKEAPWFTLHTLEKLLLVCGGFALVGLIWSVLLRRRVIRQTREIVARRTKEAQLEAELERTSRLESLGLLAGGIAHDFNNMLTVTVGNISLALLELPEDSNVSKLLSDAESGALKARELTQQLLTFSRGGDPVRAPVNLASIVKEAAEFATHGTSTVIDYDFDPDAHPAFVDRNQMNQVIQNLVIRARESMIHAGRIRFILRETQVFPGDFASLPPGRYLKLTISDNGAGIPTDQLRRIFDPYFSISAGASALGLATAHSIVRRHAGHIEVSSKVEEGTTFTLLLPTAEALPPAAPCAVPVSTQEVKGLKVLFMDDDESIRRFAETLFERLGHHATIVANGTEAVHAYAAAWEIDKPFDAVILDLTVPGGMGGSEALEHLQNINPKVKAIVSSGYSSDPIMSEYRKHGFSAIVSKPYKISELSKALQEVVAEKP